MIIRGCGIEWLRQCNLRGCCVGVIVAVGMVMAAAVFMAMIVVAAVVAMAVGGGLAIAISEIGKR